MAERGRWFSLAKTVVDRKMSWVGKRRITSHCRQSGAGRVAQSGCHWRLASVRREPRCHPLIVEGRRTSCLIDRTSPQQRALTLRLEDAIGDRHSVSRSVECIGHRLVNGCITNSQLSTGGTSGRGTRRSDTNLVEGRRVGHGNLAIIAIAASA
jgi:hypothetical protein